MTVLRILIVLIVFGPMAALSPAAAQSETTPRFLLEGLGQPGDQGLRAPMLPQTGVLRLDASYAETGTPISAGLIWRIFEERPGADTPALVARSDEPEPAIALPPGNYVIHASYGYASQTQRITMLWSDIATSLRVSAGALSVRGVVSDAPVPPTEIRYAVYVPVGGDQEGRLVAANVRGDEIVRLPEGTYHVVSTFGDGNSIMRTDIEVEAGQITEATLNHRAATVTLKLVGYAGGEAYAGTAFSVLTPGGDVVREAIGAFPSVTLAEGEYVVIARHDGTVYTREFAVVSGLDRDIEVLAGQ